jgi:hypothetical protein
MLRRAAQDQLGVQDDVGRLPSGGGDLGEQLADHAGAHGVDRLAHRGQPRIGLLRGRRIVEPDDGHVVGDAATSSRIAP